MSDPQTLQPIRPVLVADRFPALGKALVELLRSLGEEQWARPTVCSAWAVRDVVAHLIDSGFRRLSFERDRYAPPAPATPIEDRNGLVEFLDQLNARWVSAAKRLSPKLLTELIEFLEPRLAEHLASLDPWSVAMFPVAWAGEDASPTWFDVARELTERWHHQGQIRLAVAAPPLDDPWLSEPVFDTFLRALPYRYGAIEVPAGESLVVRINGRRAYGYTLRREGSGWILLKGEAHGARSRIALDEETAWLLLTTGISAAEARRRALVEGDPHLCTPFFDTVAVMAL